MNVTTNMTEILHVAETVNEHLIEETTESLTLVLTFTGLLLCSIATIISQKFLKWMPHNVLYMVIGLCIAHGAELISGIDSKDRLQEMFAFHPGLFSYAFTPLIMFESGFSGDAIALLDNSFSAIIFVCIECLLGTILCSFFIYFLPRLFGLTFISFINSVALSIILLPTETSTIIPLLNKVHVSKNFTHLLLGEGMFTEMFAIILMRALVEVEVEAGNILDVAVNLIVTFSTTLIGSILIGFLLGILSALAFKYISAQRDEDSLFVEITIFLCCPFLAYMIAETMRLSGNIAIRVCGITMAKYTQFNMSTKSYPYALFILLFSFFNCRIAEVTVFLLFGFSSNIDKDMFSDYKWILLTFIIMMSVRGLLVSLFRNRNTVEEPRDNLNQKQYKQLLWLSGLKGCLNYVLVITFQNELLHPSQVNILTHVSEGIIWITVVGIGSIYQLLLNILNVSYSSTYLPVSHSPSAAIKEDLVTTIHKQIEREYSGDSDSNTIPLVIDTQAFQYKRPTTKLNTNKSGIVPSASSQSLLHSENPSFTISPSTNNEHETTRNNSIHEEEAYTNDSMDIHGVFSYIDRHILSPFLIKNIGIKDI
ncbi:hypothetical protein WA158_007983 [Blastocystis sp. Blastoise]